jgi:DNA-3-methyladenine glycosylase II
MPKSWKLSSKSPHDFFISLDIDQYFDYEHDPSVMFEEGFTRPIPVGDRDILLTIFFNGDPDRPEFTIQSQENLNDNVISVANKSLKRILGTELNLQPLYEQAEDDPVIGPLLREFYGFKRISRANFFEDALNRIIQTQIQHKPTARKMVYNIREAYGKLIVSNGHSVPAWPRPVELIGADPVKMKQYGLSLRKGEYLVGLANEIVSGEIDIDELEKMEPQAFYDLITRIRGIGPTTAQDLMLFREQPHAVFPSHWQKKGEKGLRRWIIFSYGGDPDYTSEEEFQEMIKLWKGYEALALEYLFINYVMNEKKRASENN